jgi:WD40 repeat protein
MPIEVDASNSCIPETCNLAALCPPLPTATRGEPCVLDGHGGRINGDRPVLLYSSGRLVVVRELDGEVPPGDHSEPAAVAKWKGGIERPARVRAFVYRGHTAQVTAARFSPSGCYVASADVRGRLRIWSYDNVEHLARLDLSTALAGPIRDLSWDFESKRIALVGEGSKTDASSLCAKVIQWDTGVSCGELAQHTRTKASSCAFKPNRPMRIATGGTDDSRVLFNKGPPFVRVVGDPAVAEHEHSRGSVFCVRYSRDGTKVVSVGTDKSVVFYDGKTMALLHKMADVHTHSIYMCDWNSDGTRVITSSADGTVKLIDADKYEVVHTWTVAADRLASLEVNAASSAGGGGTTCSSHSPPTSPRIPTGGMQMGCAFVKGDIPVSVSLSGQITLLSTSSDIVPAADAVHLGANRQLSGHQAAVATFAIDPATQTLYSGDTDGVICAWNLATARAVGRFRLGEGDEGGADSTLLDRVQGGAITSMVYVDGTLVSSGWDDKIRFGSGKGLVMDRSVKLEAQPNAMAKGTNLVCCLTVKGALLMRNNEIVSDGIIALPYDALSVTVAIDDATVIVGGEDCKIYVYKVDMSDPSSVALKKDHVIENGHLKAVHALELSNDGKMLASADVRDVCVWSVDEGWTPIVAKGRWCFHTQRITCLAWSKDDAVLASGGNDDSIYLWSLAKKMKRVHYPFAHRGGIAALAFLDSGDSATTVVSTGSDACICQWDVTADVASKFG